MCVFMCVRLKECTTDVCVKVPNMCVCVCVCVFACLSEVSGWVGEQMSGCATLTGSICPWEHFSGEHLSVGAFFR